MATSSDSEESELPVHSGLASLEEAGEAEDKKRARVISYTVAASCVIIGGVAISLLVWLGETIGAKKAAIALSSCYSEHSLDCNPEYPDALLLYTSSGFGTYIENGVKPEPCVLMAFRDLVLKLPDNAWTSGGAARKRAAQNRSFSDLVSSSFFEPELYSGLSVVILDDTCYLKDSFWNKANPDFSIPYALTYEQMSLRTDVNLVKPFLGKLLDGWCVNYSYHQPPFIGGLGFEAQQVQQLSIFDRLAKASTKRAIFDLITSKGKAPLKDLLDSKADMSTAEAKMLKETLSSASILIVNGGNPDFAKYVFMHFAPELMDSALEKIKTGKQLYSGQSAGGMVMSADIGLSYGVPYIMTKLLGNNTTGIGLAGRCATKPHDDGDAAGKWDLTAAVYGKLKNLTVVRLMNGQGMRCDDAICQVVSRSDLDDTLDDSVFAGVSDPSLERLTAAF